jgi:hypothetical protein
MEEKLSGGKYNPFKSVLGSRAALSKQAALIYQLTPRNLITFCQTV